MHRNLLGQHLRHGQKAGNPFPILNIIFSRMWWTFPFQPGQGFLPLWLRSATSFIERRLRSDIPGQTTYSVVSKLEYHRGTLPGYFPSRWAILVMFVEPSATSSNMGMNYDVYFINWWGTVSDSRTSPLGPSKWCFHIGLSYGYWCRPNLPGQD